MLSMKTLRVAIVAMGSALLFGPGLALAQAQEHVINLDGSTAMTTPAPPVPLQYAVESLTAGTGGTYAIGNENAFTLQVTSGVALQANEYFLRLELGGGLVFVGDPTSDDGTRVQGGTGMNQVVFRLSEVTLDDAAIAVVVTDHLALTSNAEGSHTATMSLHRDQFDAIDGVEVVASGMVGGSATIVQAVSGIDAFVKAGDPAVADVGQSFLWFVGPPGGPANINRTSLGTVKAARRNLMAGTVLAADGMELDVNTLIDDATGVTIGIDGNLGIGVWDAVLIEDGAGMEITDIDDVATGDQPPVCPANTGTPDNPAEAGNLVPDEDDPNMAMSEGMAPGVYMICVNVDTAGDLTNMSPIPAGEYNATVYTLKDGGNPRLETAMAAEGVLGSIRSGPGNLNNTLRCSQLA